MGILNFLDLGPKGPWAQGPKGPRAHEPMGPWAQGPRAQGPGLRAQGLGPKAQGPWAHGPMGPGPLWDARNADNSRNPPAPRPNPSLGRAKPVVETPHWDDILPSAT